MTNTQLFTALRGIDHRLIDDALTTPAKKSRKPLRIVIPALAAAIALIICAAPIMHAIFGGANAKAPYYKTYTTASEMRNDILTLKSDIYDFSSLDKLADEAVNVSNMLSFRSPSCEEANIDESYDYANVLPDDISWWYASSRIGLKNGDSIRFSLMSNRKNISDSFIWDMFDKTTEVRHIGELEIHLGSMVVAEDMLVRTARFMKSGDLYSIWIEAQSESAIEEYFYVIFGE